MSFTNTAQGQQQRGSFTLLLFASASTYCNDTSSLTLPAPTTLPQLIDDLEARYPGIGEKILKSCQIVVNLDYVDVDVSDVVERKTVDGCGDERDWERRVGHEVVIHPGDEVAVVPPVSSG